MTFDFIMNTTSIENTKCVILAAGTSSRLRPLTDELPKCLLAIQGKTILQRMIEHLFAAGVRRIAVVIGFHGEMIRQHLRNVFPQHRFKYILNPNYPTTNNAYSLLLAKKYLEDHHQKITSNLLLLDSDLLFGSQLLPAFLSADASDKIAVRIQGEHNDEEIGITVNAAGTITTIGKNITGATGESVGIELFSPSSTEKLFAVLEQRVRAGSGRTEYYEVSFQQLIEQGSEYSMVDVSEHPIMEIDTMKDYQQAQRLILD